MMRAYKISFIREKCIDANPDIVALKFGCEVELKIDKIDDDPIDKTERLVQISNFAIQGVPHGDVFVAIRGVQGMVNVTELKKSGRIKILGRPIRLADVMLAIEKFSDLCMLLHSGETNAQSVLYKLMDFWNLRADNLEEQSEETIAFLAELLK